MDRLVFYIIKEIDKQEQSDKLLEDKEKKRYKNKDWNEIYEKRFERFQIEKNKKIKERRSEKKSREKQLEEKIVQRIKLTKKCSDIEINKFSNRLCYDDIASKKKNLENLNKKFQKDEIGQKKSLLLKKSSFERNYNVISFLNQSESDHISNFYSEKSIIHEIKSPKSDIKIMTKKSLINQEMISLSPKGRTSIKNNKSITRKQDLIQKEKFTKNKNTVSTEKTLQTKRSVIFENAKTYLINSQLGINIF